MKILFSAFSAYSPYGSESLVGHNYARFLGRRHRLTVITCKPTDVTTEIPGVERVQTLDLGGRDFNEISRGSLLSFELKQWRPARRALSEGIDLIHRVNPCSINDPTLLAYVQRPLVVGPILSSGNPPESFREIIWREIHHHKETASLAEKVQLRHRLGRLLFDPLRDRWSHLKRARRILVGSADTMKEIPEELHGRCEPIVYAGVEHGLFTPAEPGASRPGPIRLLWVGRLKPHKGIEMLLRACSRLKPGTPFSLTVIGRGTGYFEEFIKGLGKELGVEEQIRWIPAVERSELPEIYRSHDVFCFPSVSDTYGVALLEAMSAGLAVVVSDIAGPREIVPDGAGIRVAVESPDQYIADYAGALEELAGDPGLRAELGRAARARILERHDWNGIGERLEQIYESLP